MLESHFGRTAIDGWPRYLKVEIDETVGILSVPEERCSSIKLLLSDDIGDAVGFPAIYWHALGVLEIGNLVQIGCIVFSMSCNIIITSMKANIGHHETVFYNALIVVRAWKRSFWMYAIRCSSKPMRRIALSIDECDAVSNTFLISNEGTWNGWMRFLLLLIKEFALFLMVFTRGVGSILVMFGGGVSRAIGMVSLEGVLTLKVSVARLVSGGGDVVFVVSGACVMVATTSGCVLSFPLDGRRLEFDFSCEFFVWLS